MRDYKEQVVDISGHKVRNSAERRYGDTKAASSVSSIPAGTLRNWRSAGIGPPYIKIGAGSKVLYDLDKLAEWLDSQTVGAA